MHVAGACTCHAVPAHHLIAPSRVQGKEAPFRRQYIIRVLIPCYKESLAIIQRTVLAAKRADRPHGTRMVIYICDDGNDEKKVAWVQRIEDPEVCRPPDLILDPRGGQRLCLMLPDACMPACVLEQIPTCDGSTTQQLGPRPGWPGWPCYTASPAAPAGLTRLRRSPEVPRARDDGLHPVVHEVGVHSSWFEVRRRGEHAVWARPTVSTRAAAGVCCGGVCRAV